MYKHFFTDINYHRPSFFYSMLLFFKIVCLCPIMLCIYLFVVAENDARKFCPEATNRGNFGMTEILQFLKIARDYSIVQFTTMYIMSSTIFKVFFSKFLIIIKCCCLAFGPLQIRVIFRFKFQN